MPPLPGRGWRDGSAPPTVAQVEEALQTMLRLLSETRTRMLSVDGEQHPLPPQRGPRRVHVGAGFVVASLLEPGAVAP